MKNLIASLFYGVTPRSFFRACLYFMFAYIISVYLVQGTVGIVELISVADFKGGPASEIDKMTANFSYHVLYAIPYICFVIFLGRRGWFTALAIKNEHPFFRRVGMRVLACVSTGFILAFFSVMFNAGIISTIRLFMKNV